MLIKIFLLILWKTVFVTGDCVAQCHMVKMKHNVVPTRYNHCFCELSSANVDDLFSSQEICQPNYRSLKFRQNSSGVIVLHKAVVASCIGLDSKHYVNQSIFDEEERNFQLNRNYHVSKEANLVPLDETSPTGGFRSYVMQQYRKLDGHLRFG